MLFGCPYEAKFSLSNPAESNIDTTLIGSWEEIPSKNEKDASNIEISIFNDHEYLCETFLKEGGGLMMQNFRAFATALNHQKFLNIQEIGNKPKFSFYKYSISKDTLKTSAVSDVFSKEEFNSREELITFILKNMNDPKFYEENRIFIKKKK
jgi:uncharacterized protein YbaA (DUF1428 family)